MSISLETLGLFALTALLVLATGCAKVGRSVEAPRLSTRASEARELAAPPAESVRSSAGTTHAVLTANGRVFVLLNEPATLTGSAERLLVPGGWSLSLGAPVAHEPEAFTLVGPDGSCVGRATAALALALDLGGYASASLPTRAEKALELEGCSALANSKSLLIAVRGADPNAHWLHPAHIDDAPAPADRRLGENEVWIHRFALAESDLEIVERSVVRYVTPSCSEEAHELILVDELGKPVESYPDFELRGALTASGRVLLVLTGHDDPEALRIVELGEASATSTLDTRVAAFDDTAHAGC